MKKLFLLYLAIALIFVNQGLSQCSCPFLPATYSTIKCEGFETYGVNSSNPSTPLPLVGDWSLYPGSNQIPDIEWNSTYGLDLLIIETNGDDVLYDLDDKSSGEYQLSFDIFVGFNDEGYYNIQHSSNGASWAFQVYFQTDNLGNGNGTGSVRDGNNNTLFNFSYFNSAFNNPIEISHNFNLNTNSVDFYVNGTFFGDIPFIGNLGAINFFAVDNNFNFSIDNICYSEDLSSGGNTCDNEIECNQPITSSTSINTFSYYGDCIPDVGFLGADETYCFDVDCSGEVNIECRNLNADASIFLMNDCPSNGGVCLDYDFGDQFNPAIITTNLSPGEYCVVIEAENPQLEQQVNYTIEVECCQNPCENAEELTCGVLQYGSTFDQTNDFLESDYAPYCFSSPNPDGNFLGADVVYEIYKPTSFTDLDIHLFSNVDHDIFLFEECGNSLDLVDCSANSASWQNSPTNRELIHYSNAPAGYYYVVVDAQFSSIAGNFEIIATCGDLGCNQAEQITCGEILSRNNFSSSNNVSTYCGQDEIGSGSGCTGNERLFEFNLNEETEVEIILSGFPSSEDFELFLFDNCNDRDNCIASSTNSPGNDELINETLEPGNYTIVVDGWYETEGDFNIELKCINQQDCSFCEEQAYGDVIYCDDFESYNVGIGLAQQSPDWNRWGPTVDLPIGIENGDQFLNVFWESPISKKVINDLGSFTNGRFRLAWEYYVNANSTASYSIAHNHSNNSINEAFEVKFNGSGRGTVLVGGSNSPLFNFSYPSEVFFNVVHIIDLDKDEIELFINNQFIGSWVFSEAAITKTKRLGSLCFTNGENGSNFRVDNICFRATGNCINEGLQIFCTTLYDPVCVADTTYSNACFAQCDGYTEDEWTEGPCIGCDDCLDCFTYIPDEIPTQISFYNNYCPEDTEVHKSNSTFLYNWDVKQSGTTTSVQYQNNTSSNSEHPIIKFPGQGTYEVCFKVYNDGILLYECCLPVIVLPNPCYDPPGCHFGATFNNFNNRFTFNSDDTRRASELRWELPDGMSLVNGTNQSDVIICKWPVPECKEVCLTAVNECGISTYCIEVCGSNHPDCDELTPQLNYVEPVVNGMTVSFPDLDGTNYVEANWKVLGGTFLNGTDLNSFNPVIELPDYGNHFICVELYEDGCGKVCICWTVSLPRPGKCEGQVCETTLNCGDIVYTSQSNSNFQYNIQNTSGKDICSWEVAGSTVNQSSNSIITSFPGSGNYEVCYYYWDYEEWCLKKCCEDYTVPPLPDNCDRNQCSGTVLNCDKFTYNYTGQNGNLNYQFSGTSLAPDEEFCRWEVFNQNNQLINSSSSPNFSYSFNSSGVYVICYYYWNGTCIEKCCRTIYVDDPFLCGDDLTYEVQGTDARFSISGNFSNISWEDGAGNTVNQNNLLIRIPNQCQERIIKVRYFDSVTGCWYLCCKRVYLCQPTDCEDVISYRWDFNSNTYLFSLIEQGATNISWKDDYTGRLFGQGMSTAPYPTPVPCVERTVSVTYKDAQGVWRICCKRVRLCPPTDCEGLILYNWNTTTQNFEFSLNTSNVSNIEWQIDEDGISFGNGDLLNVPYPLPLPCTEKTISVRYKDNNGIWYICCKRIRLCPPLDCEGVISYNWNRSIDNYEVSLNVSGAQVIDWRIDESNTSFGAGMNTNVRVPIPPACIERTISVRYKEADGNYYICCKRIYLCRPDECEESLTYFFNGSNIEVKLTPSNINPSTISWFNDTDNQLISTGSTSVIPIPNPPSGCVEKWISVQYFDPISNCWVTCCRKIEFCNVDDLCNASIDFNFISQQNQTGFYRFELNVDVNSIDFTKEIQWIDDNTGNVFGSGLTVNYDSLPCRELPISVRYYDKNLQVWKICCRIIYVCSPFDCTILDVTSNGGNSFTFSIPSNFDQTSWYRVGLIGIQSNSNIFTDPDVWTEFTYCVYYRDPSTNCFYQCCVTINPDDYCEEPTAKFDYTINGQKVQFTNQSTSIEGNEWYQWRFGDGANSNTTNPSHTYSSQDVFEVCLEVTDGCGDDTYCEDVSLIPSVIFDIEDNVCGATGDIISVPVRVRNFNEIATCQFSIEIANETIGEIIGVQNENPILGIFPFHFGPFTNPERMNFFWAEQNGGIKTLQDSSVVFEILIKLTGDINDQSILRFSNNPTEIKAANQSMLVPTSTVSGSFCIIETNATLSGLIYRIKNNQQETIKNVTVQLSGSSNQVAVTAEDGIYQFSGVEINKNASVIPAKRDGLKNGVDGLDIIKIRQHILSQETFRESYTHIAADVDNNKSIDGLDIIRIRQLILGTISEFPNNSSWRFVDADYTFSNQQSPLNDNFPEMLNYFPLENDKVNQDFIGVKIGDVNQTGIPEKSDTEKNDEESNGFQNISDLLLKGAMVQGNQGDTVVFEISSAGFNNLIVLEYSLNWNHSLIEYVGEPHSFHPDFNGGLRNVNFGLSNTNAGKLSFSWQDENVVGVSIPENEPLFKVNFVLKGNAGESSLIEFSDSPTRISVYDINSNTVGFEGTAGSVTILEKEDLKISQSFTNPLCHNDNDGSISLNITGGSGNYSIIWNTGDSNISELGGLSPGNYSATITDNETNESAETGTIQIVEPDSISLELFKTMDITCFGLRDGAALAVADGGTGNLTYTWSSGSTDFTSWNMVKGVHTVSVTDENDCSLIDSIEIVEPEQLELSVSSIFDINSQGTAEVIVSGGVSPYGYAWGDPQRQTTRIATNLIPGTYDVTVTDANDCSNIATVVVEGVSSTKSNPLEEGIEIYPNPSNGEFFIKITNGYLGSSSNLSEVNLLSIEGDLIEKWKLDNQIQNEKLQFKVSNKYANGIYLIQLKFEDRIQFQRIILE